MTAIDIGGTTTALAGNPATVRGRYGALTIAPDGTYTYTADPNPSMPEDIENIDTFTYTATATSGYTTSSTLEVHVTFNGGAYQ